MLNRWMIPVTRATQRFTQTYNHLKPNTAATMATLGAPEKRHKVTVVGSGNWYVYHYQQLLSKALVNRSL